MTNSAWNAYDAPPTRRRSWWKILPVLAVIAVVLTVGITVLVGFGTANRHLNWPYIRMVDKALRTDQETQALWQRNPQLQEAHPDLAAFLDMARTYRTRTIPPSTEPQERYDRYLPMDSPGQVQAVYREPGAPTWLAVTAETTPPGSPPPSGEGLTSVDLLEGEEVSQVMGNVMKARRLRVARQFQALAKALATDDGLQALLQREPQLKANLQDVSAWLKQMRALRPRLKEILETPPQDWKRFRTGRNGPPWQPVERWTFRFQDRARLSIERGSGWLLRITYTE